MNGLDWIDAIDHEAEAAKQAGVTDEQIAYALIGLGAGFPFGAELAPHADLVWKLAWLLNVRAPGLDPRWLVKSALHLDKVYWGVLPLGQLLDLVRGLEREAMRAHADVERWLESVKEDPDVDPIRAMAAGRPAVAELTGDALADHVGQDISRVKHHVERGALVELVAEPLRRGS